MSIEIKVPTLGESVSEATVGQWFKNKGDAVAQDESIVELETDKVTIEISAPSAGVLSEIHAAEGDTVELDALLAVLTPGEGAAASPAAVTEAVASAEAEPVAVNPDTAQMPPAPSAAKLMQEQDLATGDVTGSGKRGQILKQDVLAALQNPAPTTSAPAPALQQAASAASSHPEQEERVRMTRLRQTIANRLKDAQNTSAMLTTFNDVDMSAVINLRKQYKELFEKKHGVRLGFMGFFVKAVVHALREVPAVNAEIDGADLVYKNYYHIGVAVGTDKGLVVPVVRNADNKNIASIETDITNYAKKARDGKISIEDMQGGTFTVTNGGVYGSLMSTPILNMPQSGILGMHRTQERPVAINGQVVIRPMMYLALSYDHRIVDGKEAVTFLVHVKNAIEDPQRLVLDL